MKTSRGNILLRVVAGLGLIAMAVAISLWLNREQDVQGPPGPRGGVPMVITEPVRVQVMAREIEALGTSSASESVTIASRVSGRIERINFREGEPVARGQVLIELEANEQRAALAEAEANLVESRNQLRRAASLFDQRVISQSQLDELDSRVRADEARVAAAQARLTDFLIRAPFDGRVGLRRVSVGALVGPNDIITTLDDTRVIKVDFSVPETFLADVEVGLDITAESIAFPDRPFRGTVESIDSRIDPITRSVTVRAAVPNPDGQLRPGMFFSVQLSQLERQATLIPEAALVPVQNRQFVFVIRDGVAERREVITGRRRPGIVEVVQGLEAGEDVVVEGVQKVRPGAPVRALAATSLPDADGEPLTP
ncbi:MAG: efflux RND transporter periplasmic adaptor subunit [Gammaproteobacteria bacterium]|nr:MAG: efflux RND transporter periplasmic adaptor subunit [Gammaproteobacteria bacterium]